MTTPTATDVVGGWHFSGGRLRDGREIVVGRWEVHDGPLVMCAAGYHLSERPIDALRYAPGAWVGRVEGRGEMIRDVDKVVCRERRYVEAPRDVARLLRRFARSCALDVAHRWTPPEVVIQYLLGGEETIAYSAANAAVNAAAAYTAINAAVNVAAAYTAVNAAVNAAAHAAGAAANVAVAAQNARLESWLGGPELPDEIALDEIAPVAEDARTMLRPAQRAAQRIERLVKRAGQHNRDCDLPHWPGVGERLVLWDRIERIVADAIRTALRARRAP